LTLDPRFIRSFDAIWASPPCLRDTVMRHAPGAKGEAHPDLITPTRALLRHSGLPYVLENVETAPLIDPVILCGSMFDLGVTVGGTRYQLRRHRKFEANWSIPAPKCRHCGPVIGVYGGHARCRAAKAGGRGTVDFAGVEDKTALMREAMGVTRQLTGAEVSQGVPPTYAFWIGRRLINRISQGGFGACQEEAA
jgi:DNA (cytosine-5)-methyltransferase 1